MLYLMPENQKKVIFVKPLPKSYKGVEQLHNLFHSLTSKENFLRTFIDYTKQKHEPYDSPWAKLSSKEAGLYMPSVRTLYCTEELINKYMVSLQLIADTFYFEPEIIQPNLGLLLQRTHQNQGKTKFVYDAGEIPFDVELAAILEKMDGIKPNEALEKLGDTYPDFAMFWSTIYPLLNLSDIEYECSLAEFRKRTPNVSETIIQNNTKIIELINKNHRFRRRRF